MRIQIKSEDGNIDIPIPTGLVFSKAAAWTWLKIVRKATSRYLPQKIGKKADSVMDALSDEAVYALCAELMRIKRKYLTIPSNTDNTESISFSFLFTQ